LRETVAEIVKPLGIRAGQKSLELTADVPASVPDALVGDPGRLRQVLINLIGNAIKFTEQGEISLEVRAASHLNGHVHLQFAVTDTGIGIPPDKQSAIFSPFVQADGSTTRRFGGTGLGLAISSGIVQQMGGHLKVASQPDHGSRFEFTASFGRGTDLAPAAAPVKPERLKGLRTLIVDDNHTNRRILEEMTRHWGMIPVAVDGGRKALDELERARLANTSYDLLLLDAMMPEMDGFMMVEALAHQPQISRATVIMLSSVAQANESDRARRLGIAGVLIKPVTQAELLKEILAILGKRILETAPRPAAPAKAARSLRLLMAEDNPINQQVARNFLTQRGHEVVIAGNGLEAVAIAQDSVFDLILMDIQMPEMDGLEATARIREMQRIQGRHTPIIALTARAMKEDVEHYLASGMEAFISKPFTRAEFLKVIEQVAESAPNPA